MLLILSRRKFLILAGASATDYTIARGRQRQPRSLVPHFHIPLPIPSVLRPVRTDNTTDYYEITQREAEIGILPGLRTRFGAMKGCSLDQPSKRGEVE